MSLLRTCTSLLLLVPSLALAREPSPAARRWWSHVEVLASDGMEGRDTGSEGHRRAAGYVAEKLAELGVQPGAGQGYLQDVPLLSRRLVKERSRMALVREGQEEPLSLDEDLILSSLSGRAGPVDAGLVFVGYGLSIPEAGHDDLAGLELKGKVIVVLFGGIPPGVPGNLAAHYGTLAERVKAYTRAGVAGVLGVMNPHAMEVPWERAKVGQDHPVMMLADPALRDLGDIPLFSLASPTLASKLVAGEGHTFEEVAAQAKAGKPMPRFALPVSVRGEVALESSQLTSVNVVGRLPGSDPKLAGESVVLSAHLDHVGLGEPVNGDGDRIYNGAMDNASGVAALLEVARTFQEKKVRPRRSVLFVAVTGEEKGLLGSRAFAAHPTEGSGRMVANLNLDMFMPLTPLKQLVAYGVEESSLAAPLKASARRLGVEVMRDPNPEANVFVRSDQYSFIREGVPALSFKFGYRKGSKEERLHEEWFMKRYHGPSDDLAQPVDREGAVRFVQLLADLTRRVADAPERPSWNEDSFFRRFERAEAPAPTARPIP
ncbi:M20/M25/M40 family metallo-hydrolase [Archangium violaceum]|uniref:M28 family metallopeptidase n=1 Tax=Archangium violaceum TaxID=83451 RepID=UPI001950B158|nr:M28 family metallopeptidase [Archangium violaceum]QRO01735.1 M20/M25/M40 family metallo-hydrolase [Archangium violaceum]